MTFFGVFFSLLLLLTPYGLTDLFFSDSFVFFFFLAQAAIIPISSDKDLL